MFEAAKTGLSGLLASTTRLNVAANNIANINTTSRVPTPEAAQSLAGQQAYQAKRTFNQALENGGVRATAVPVKPAHQPVYAPNDANANEDGIVNYPNLSLAEEIVQLKIAAQTYKANAAVIRTAFELSDTLLKDTK